MARREEGSGAGNQGLDAVVGRGENEGTEEGRAGRNRGAGEEHRRGRHVPIAFSMITCLPIKTVEMKMFHRCPGLSTEHGPGFSLSLYILSAQSTGDYLKSRSCGVARRPSTDGRHSGSEPAGAACGSCSALRLVDKSLQTEDQRAAAWETHSQMHRD